MTAWRVGSKTQVTLFKGDELFGMLVTPEKAAVVARWLDFAERYATGGELQPGELSDAELERAFDAFLFEMVRRGRRGARGVEALAGAPEGGAEGDRAVAGEAGVWGGDAVPGAGDGGGRAEGDGGGAGQ